MLEPERELTRFDYVIGRLRFYNGSVRLSGLEEPRRRSGRGAVVAHPLWERGVVSSNLAAPTIYFSTSRPVRFPAWVVNWAV